jgi:hypothetical protein
MTEPTEESQLAGLAHLRQIAEEQAAAMAEVQAATAETEPLGPGTAPPEKVAGAVPRPRNAPSDPDLARGDGRRLLASARRAITLGWRRDKGTKEG